MDSGNGNKPWYMQGAPATNLSRAEASRRARAFLESDDYSRQLESRIKTGTLPSAVETMLWHYAYGKPKEELEVKTLDFSALSTEDLLERARVLSRELEEVETVDDSIPREYKVM